MSTDSKPFASLSSGLLARKGAARPAMRPQGFGQAGASLEDLGWNDMGFEPPKPAANPALDGDHDDFGEVVPAHPHKLAGLTPVDSPVHDQQAQIAGRLSAASVEDDEDFDETAELYDPEAETETAEQAAVEAETPAITVPMVKPVRMPIAEPEPQAVIEQTAFSTVEQAPAARRQSKPRSQSGSKAKAAFTLRLEAERHLKLRLACAVTGRSAQMLVTQALDAFLEGMPELDSMASKARSKG